MPRLFGPREIGNATAVKLAGASHLVSLGSAGTTLTGLGGVGVAGFTVCGWTYFDTALQASTVFAYRGGAGRYLTIENAVPVATVEMRLGDSQTGLTSFTNQPSPNEWLFLAVSATAVGSGDTISGYWSPRDGENFELVSRANGIEDSVSGEVIQLRGDGANGTRHRYWRAFDRALSLDELRRLKADHAPRGDEFFYWPLAHSGDLRDFGRGNRRATYSAGLVQASAFAIPNKRRPFLLDTADSGIVGEANITLATFTTTATGAVALAGAASVTTAAFTTTATGTLALAGASSMTLDAFTTTATGTGTATVGEANVTTADFTTTATGTLALAGTSSTTMDFSTTATGTLPVVGTSSMTLDAFTTTATGTVPIVGTASVTVATFTTTATGAVQLAGLASVSTADFTTSATGTLALAGAGGGTIDFTTTATGTVALVGASSMTLDAFTTTAAGHRTAKEGSASLTLATFTTTATGQSNDVLDVQTVSYGPPILRHD